MTSPVRAGTWNPSSSIWCGAMLVPDLFFAMMKEEWRIHSTVFGGFWFALFPVMIVVFAFLGSLTLPLFSDAVPYTVAALLAQIFFLLAGAMVGSFGLMGREFMNRRFGQASLIAYVSRSLPISERRIFATFLMKDTIYYILLYVLPFTVGFAAATPFISIDPGYILLAFASLALAFLIGLSAVCFLSTLYAHSVRLLAATLVVLALALFHAGTVVFPPYSFFLDPGLEPLALSLLFILIPAAISVLFVTVDYPDQVKRFKNSSTPSPRDSARSGVSTSSPRMPSTCSGAKVAPGRWCSRSSSPSDSSGSASRS
ncbi:MAG: hypothetical protein RQM90_08415 [Methanoculleus sp.]